MRFCKYALLFVVAALSAFVLAQAVVQRANGRGKAETADHRIGTFNFEVSRTLHENHVTIAGHFVLETTDPEADGSVRILLPAVQDATFDGKTVRFSGPGSIRFKRRSNGEVVERGGTVTVYARDNRPPHHDGTPDRLACTFRGTGEHPITYNFEGNVFDGDIFVGE